MNKETTTTAPDSSGSGKVFGIMREAMGLSIEEVAAAAQIEPTLMGVIGRRAPALRKHGMAPRQDPRRSGDRAQGTRVRSRYSRPAAHPPLCSGAVSRSAPVTQPAMAWEYGSGRAHPIG